MQSVQKRDPSLVGMMGTGSIDASCSAGIVSVLRLREMHLYFSINSTRSEVVINFLYRSPHGDDFGHVIALIFTDIVWAASGLNTSLVESTRTCAVLPSIQNLSGKSKHTFLQLSLCQLLSLERGFFLPKIVSNECCRMNLLSKIESTLGNRLESNKKVSRVAKRRI